MPKVKGQYKIIRIYNNSIESEKTIRINLTEKQAIEHCESKNGRGIEDGKSYVDYYTYIKNEFGNHEK